MRHPIVAGLIRRHKRPRTFAVALSILAVAVAVPATAGAASPDSVQHPAAGHCAAQAGGFTWNTIWRVDTSGYAGPVGFICTFAGRPESALAADPRLRGPQQLCASSNGSFYTFSQLIGPDPQTDTAYSGYGCEWLF